MARVITRAARLIGGKAAGATDACCLVDVIGLGSARVTTDALETDFTVLADTFADRMVGATLTICDPTRAARLLCVCIADGVSRSTVANNYLNEHARGDVNDHKFRIKQRFHL